MTEVNCPTCLSEVGHSTNCPADPVNKYPTLNKIDIFVSVVRNRITKREPTPTELEVAYRAVVEGLSVGEIGVLRHTSSKTAETQLHGIFRKLGMGSRQGRRELFRLYVREEQRREIRTVELLNKGVPKNPSLTASAPKRKR